MFSRALTVVTLVCFSLLIIARAFVLLTPQQTVVSQPQEVKGGVRSDFSVVEVSEAVQQLRSRIVSVRGPVAELQRRLQTQQPREHARRRTSNDKLVYHERRGSIFVVISSYDDTRCGETIVDLFQAAKDPSKIHVGLVEQHREETSPCISDVHRLCNLSEFCPTDQIRHRRIPTQLAKGVSWARSVAALQFRGEQFVLVVDSHTIFTRHWDELLVAQLLAAEELANGATPVITYEPEWKTAGEAQHAGNQLNYLCKPSFHGPGLVAFSPEPRQLSGRVPQKVPMVSSHFLFTSAKMLTAVPFDPTLQYVSEGLDYLLAARLWTSGFDFFEPGRHIVFRRKSSANMTRANSTVIGDTARSVWWPRQEAAKRRMAQILRVIPRGAVGTNATTEADDYGLGTVRSLRQFELLSGVDLSRGEATKDVCARGR